MRSPRLAASIIAWLASHFALAVHSEEPLVTLGDDNRLVYQPYANRGETERVNVVPDFSRCGYGGGGVPIPSDIPIRIRVAASSSDQRSILQSAIDELALAEPDADGFRGAILLEAGTHYLSGGVTIGASGIVLVGEGQLPASDGGTELIATLREQHTLITIKGSNDAQTGPRLDLAEDFTPSGSFELPLADASSLEIGDRIQIVFTPNQSWIDLLGMGQYGWTPSAYATGYERFVVSKNGNTISLDAPTVQPLRSAYGGGYARPYQPAGRVSACSVQNLFITSEYANDTDENHGWTAIQLIQTENCWVSDVTARYFGYACVRLEGANFTTVQNCAMLDPKSQTTGGRKYSFLIDGGTYNLIQRCYARGGRHDVVTGSHVAGPNVFLDIYMDDNKADPGPHHRYATGILFDNVHATSTSGTHGLYVENRKDSGSGHGWAGGQVVFWNCKAVNSVADAPPGGMNFNFGFLGTEREGRWAPEEPRGHWESLGVPIRPRSFYLQQLQDRLGVDATLATATPLQLRGAIDAELASWQGLGHLREDESFADWLERNGIRDPNAFAPQFGLPARDAYLTGADISPVSDAVTIIPSPAPSPRRFRVECQRRIASSLHPIELTTSANLTDWSAIDTLAETTQDVHRFDGIRRQVWEIDADEVPSRFFRLTSQPGGL